jgi:hypothetical protein
MSNLPQQQTFPQLQTKWASILNPVVSNLLVQGHILQNIDLIDGTTVVNHGLGRKLLGWFIVGINGAATVYDSQASNQMPELTLTLISNTAVTVSLWVF